MSKITVKKKTENFTILDNTLFKDENLSWKAKGLLAYLLHLPNDWQIYLEDLKNRSTDGKESTRTAINELIEKGYIQRTRVHENGKFKRYDYTVFEKPNFQKSENQNTEIQKSENHTLINTEFKKELNVKNTKSINIHFDEFWKIYKKKIEKLINQTNKLYSVMVEDKVQKNHARQLLPTGILNEICIAGRLTDWDHLFELRTSVAAHWEIREIAKMTQKIFNKNGF